MSAGSSESWGFCNKEQHDWSTIRAFACVLRLVQPASILVTNRCSLLSSNGSILRAQAEINFSSGNFYINTIAQFYAKKKRKHSQNRSHISGPKSNLSRYSSLIDIHGYHFLNRGTNNYLINIFCRDTSLLQHVGRQILLSTAAQLLTRTMEEALSGRTLEMKVKKKKTDQRENAQASDSMSKRWPRGSLAALRSAQAQLGKSQEQVNTQTPALPAPAGITGRSSAPYQLLHFSSRLMVLTAARAGAQEFEFLSCFPTLVC